MKSERRQVSLKTKKRLHRIRQNGDGEKEDEVDDRIEHPRDEVMSEDAIVFRQKRQTTKSAEDRILPRDHAVTQ